ncbi:RNA polymerase sigma factor [Microbulbifer halophilus]|uniref:RNA polymerase sigma factor n=1 Tax=Microbulbifer halophilus TaxID=453963 RepID=A0ABW5E5S0_9GAMM|nr:sigma-70 family RNA polymerase sigma factor [Microbulbifer halophilus]MCW8126880.1 sigma-70 family RNA polymerase sigma factor [Microbulbifer halophilus]
MRFEQKVCDQIPHLRRYALSLCADRLAAEDLVQDCLERALNKRHLWRSSGAIRSWLFRMLYRIYLNQRVTARARREVAVADAGEDWTVEAGHDPHMQCREAVAAIEVLPPEQRAALMLMVLESPSYEEAAKILDINIGTLRSRLSRARESLRRHCARGVTERDDNHLRRVK